MRKLTTVLTLLLVFSFVLAAAAPIALADEATPAADSSRPDPSPVITWTPAALTIPVAPGETGQARAVFRSRLPIAHANLVVSFPLSRYVRVEPRQYAPVTPGPLYPVDLTVTLPNETDNRLPAIIVGTIQVMRQGAVYQSPLMVTIVRKNVPPPIKWTPAEARLGVGLPTTADASTPPSTVTVSFTTTVAIAGARLRATVPLNRVLDLSQGGPIDLAPGTTYTLILTAHFPPDITSASGELSDADFAQPDPGSARRIVSGLVEVFDSQRIYARTLPVSVILGERPRQPVVTWRPPLVTFNLEAGQSASKVVTLTSNMTVENAILSVTGPITPYVTIAQTGPATILPNRPYPVTLNVTSPAAPVFNRPLNGSVVVVSGGQILRFDLKVMLFWHRPQPTPTPTATATPSTTP